MVCLVLMMYSYLLWFSLVFAQLEKTKTTLKNAKAKLEKFQATKDQVALQGLTKHDITGAMMQAGVQSYFAINQAQTKKLYLV